MRHPRHGESSPVVPRPEPLPPLRAFPAMPIEVTCGPILCRLQVWTEEEWKALPKEKRPATVAHAPGLGRVGAVPVLS